MNETQLNLFCEPTELVEQAIHLLTTNAPSHSHAEEFTRQLSARLVSLRPGSVVFAALPSAANDDLIFESLRESLEIAHKSGCGTGGPSLASVTMHPTPNRKAQDRMLYRAYRDESRLENAGQFSLGFDWRMSSPTALNAISTMLSAREKKHYYVLKRAHLLQRPGASFHEGVESVRTVIHIAQESRRTQIVMGNALPLMRWLTDPEIASAVHVCALQPYGLVDPQDLSSFRGILCAYDSVAPWAEPAPLASRIREVHQVVSGCPYRLHKWVLDALLDAKANGARELTWQRFVEFAPLRQEQDTAKEERTAMLTLRPRIEIAQTERKVDKKQFEPSRKRPDVGFSETATG
jgi:hypothetical protein